MLTRKENIAIGETILTKTLPNGLKCYIIPKKNYRETLVVAAIHYGARDLQFIHAGKEVRTPQGTAHFLEHKLFDEEGGNVFDRFSQLGGQANAFTNYDMTAYYFSCTENFEKNMALLTGFVQNPYFTDESVEKEKGIITQEIGMVHDNPIWRGFLNMLYAMYHSDPVRYSICGTAQSILDITAATLHDCYRTFYTPSNMAFILCGDIDSEQVAEDLQKQLTKSEPAQEEGQRIYTTEPPGVCTAFVTDRMPVSIPLFHFGFKLNPQRQQTAQETAVIRLMLDLMVGRTSAFYAELFDESVLNESFGYESSRGNGYGHVFFAGESTDYRRVQQKLFDTIRHFKKHGFDKEAFARVKNKYRGKYLKGFNSISSIALGQTESVFSGYDLFDLYDSILAVDLQLLNQRIHEVFREESFVCSVILPDHADKK